MADECLEGVTAGIVVVRCVVVWSGGCVFREVLCIEEVETLLP